MKFLFLATMYILISFQLRAQDSTGFKKNDTATSAEQNKKRNRRIKLVATGNVVAYGGTMIALYGTWDKNYPQSSFHFCNDNKEWLQVDKAGHLWSAYSEGRAGIA